MQELIDMIRAAIATDANKEQKAAGVQACRTIIAALDTEPGKPIVLPGVPPKPPLSSVSLDQVLDLVIGRLTTIAAREAQQAPSHAAPMAHGAPVAAPNTSRGLRVPMPAARSPSARSTTRSATARTMPVQTPAPRRSLHPVSAPRDRRKDVGHG